MTLESSMNKNLEEALCRPLSDKQSCTPFGSTEYLYSSGMFGNEAETAVKLSKPDIRIRKIYKSSATTKEIALVEVEGLWSDLYEQKRSIVMNLDSVKRVLNFSFNASNRSE
ncbi:MAG: hypothetical protein MHPSP_001883 [Paramarteilia canceri]